MRLCDLASGYFILRASVSPSVSGYTNPCLSYRVVGTLDPEAFLVQRVLGASGERDLYEKYHPLPSPEAGALP